MLTERFQIAVMVNAAIVVAFLLGTTAQGQEAPPQVADPATSPTPSAPTVAASDSVVAAVDPAAGDRSQEPTQEAKSQKPEQENAAPPTGKTRPTIKGNSKGWLPIHVVAESDSDREAIVADLNAAGFDAIDEKFYPGNRGYILAAPRPTGTWDESLALVKEIVRKNSGALMDAPPPDYSSAPHSFTSVKWKPKQADAEIRERELLKVVDALADSDLPLRHIHYDLRRDGSNYLWLIYSSSAADDVEAFVRRVVEEPAIWPPNSILLPGDESPALHALQPPTNDAPARPRGMSISGIPVRLGSEVTIELPSDGDRSKIRSILESEGYDILYADEESTWTIYLPSEADIEACVARVREVVGPTVKVKNPDAFDMPVANIERAVRRPVSIWFFTWTPENQDRAKQESERRRIEEAFGKPGLGVERIHWRGGGTDRIRAFVASPPDKIPQIEELVRTLVKEPKFWRPPQWDKYLAERNKQEPAQAASGPAPVAVTMDGGDDAEPASAQMPTDSPRPIDSAAIPQEAGTLDAIPLSTPAAPDPAPPAGTPQAPKLAAQVLLIETDWTKANDRDAASRLSRSLSNGIFEDNRAGKEVFPPGYAATFAGDDARRVGDDLQRLGLVRQAMALSQVDLKLQEKGVEALGAATVSFQERAANGQGATVTWNVLVVTEPAQAPPPGGDPFSQPRPATAPPASPPAGYRVAVVSWKDQTAATSQSQEEIVEADVVRPALEAAPEEGERYVGSFAISKDQSAIVPLALPGLEGALIVVAPTQKGPAVRSLGPRGGVLQRWGLTAEFSVDWDGLIRAYQASPLGVAGTKARLIEATEKTGDVNGGEETADVTFTWRPAQEGQVEQLQTALKERSPQTQFVLGQFQGEQGASLVVRTPARFAEAVAEAIEGVAAQILPGVQSMNSTIAMVPSENQDAEQDDERPTLVFHLEYAAADEVAKLLNSLKLDPAIRAVSDPRTNSIVLSAPEATKYRHVQAAIDLLKELDRPAEATPVAEKNAKTAPDRAANVAKLRSELARVEADVQKAAEAARSASGPERTTKGEDLRRVVAAAFDLRLKLQREEAAELRDRLKKVEENLARRERIQNAVIERRVEVLLDPALEWPEVNSEESSLPSAEVASLPADDPAQRTGDGGTGSPWKASDVQGRGDAFAAATSLAREIADLTSQAEAIERDGTPDGSELRLALIRRQLDLLRQEFDARQQALKLELESLQAKLSGAQASYERVQTLVDTGAVPQSELAKVEAELKAAQSDVARQEVLLQQYERVAPAKSVDYSESPQTATQESMPNVSASASASPFAALPDTASVPEELQGVWRPVRSSVDGVEHDFSAPSTGRNGEWRFYGPYAFKHFSDSRRKDLTGISRVVVDASTDPKRMEMHPIAMPYEQYALINERQPERYLYEIDGDRLRVAVRIYTGEVNRDFPAKLSPGKGVHFLEFERVGDAAAIVPVDEGAPAADRTDWTTSGQFGWNDASQRREDQFAIATSLALRLVELSHRIRTLEAASDASRDQDQIDAALASLELLRQEFDARDNAARRELATAAENVAVAEARLLAARKRHEARTSSDQSPLAAQSFSGDLFKAQSEAQEARDEAKYLEALITHYERARVTFEAPVTSGATSAVESVPTLGVPDGILGIWRLRRYDAGPHLKAAFSTWTFDGETLIADVSVDSGGGRFVTVFPADQPGVFQTYAFDETPGGRVLRERNQTVRFEIEGDTLRAAFSGRDAAPENVAPAEGIVYYEFDRIRRVPADASPPVEAESASTDAVDALSP